MSDLKRCLTLILALAATAAVAETVAESGRVVRGSVQFGDRACSLLLNPRIARGYGRAAGARQSDRTVSERLAELLSDVVVYIADDNPEDGQWQGPPVDLAVATKMVTMHQKDKAFVPRVLPIVIGTSVQFPNDDSFYHNVFSLTEGCCFDLGKYSKASPAKKYKFERLGIVEIFCDIHRNMQAHIRVLECPYFTTPDADGSFEIRGVPPGQWTLHAWHPALPEITIAVPADDTAVVRLLQPLILNK